MSVAVSAGPATRACKQAQTEAAQEQQPQERKPDRAAPICGRDFGRLSRPTLFWNGLFPAASKLAIHVGRRSSRNNIESDSKNRQSQAGQGAAQSMKKKLAEEFNYETGQECRTWPRRQSKRMPQCGSSRTRSASHVQLMHNAHHVRGQSKEASRDAQMPHLWQFD